MTITLTDYIVYATNNPWIDDDIVNDCVLLVVIHFKVKLVIIKASYEVWKLYDSLDKFNLRGSQNNGFVKMERQMKRQLA